MAAILNTILNDDSSDPLFSPLSTTVVSDQALPKNIESTPVSESLLAEIHAIQEALQNDADFDFSSLEPTAAGETQNRFTELNNDKSSGSPILLEDPGLLINYRSDVASSATSINNDASSESSSDNTDLTSDNALTAFSTENINQIQASVAEDFITQTQGQFAPNLNVAAQSFETSFGSFSTNELGQWQYNLNNQLEDVQSLPSGDSINDLINLTTNTGEKIQITIEINGSNDQAVITGSKQGELQAMSIEELGAQELKTHPSISGKLEVSDIDLGEARFQTNFEIQGNFGSAQINAQGEWTYTLNNDADAVQGLRSGEKLLDMFSVNTLDGTKQLIQINIEGVNDKPFLSGDNDAVLDLSSSLEAQGSLIINDPDFGESSFQALTSIRSSLGYGSADIDAQGNWSFKLDLEYTKLNSISEGQTHFDSFEVFTADGTSQMINIPIKGSDTPFYEQSDSSSQTLALHDLIQDDKQQDLLSEALNHHFDSNNESSTSEQALQTNSNQNIETAMFLNSEHDSLQTVSPHLSDISII